MKSLHHNPVNIEKVDTLPFRSFAQFKASAHNHSLQDGYDSHSTTSGTEIDSLNHRVQRDGLGRPIERYDKSLFVPTDSVGNIAALAAAIQSAKKNYVLIFSGDCSEIPTKALKAAGKKTGENTITTNRLIPHIGPLLDQAPEVKYEGIKKRNPDAREIE